MRKIYLLLLLVSGFIYGQEYLSGTAKYRLNIKGYMGRGNDGCGDIDGLRIISLKYKNNPSFITLWEGRIINQSFYHDVFYKYENEISDIKIEKKIRWETWGGSCEGGPNDRYNDISITPNFSYYLYDAGDGLKSLSITSVPIIDLENTQPLNTLLGTDSPLRISTIDGVDPKYFEWQYHILGDDTTYYEFIPDPDCDGGAPPLNGPVALKMSAKAIDPDGPPVYCPDIAVAKSKPNWRLLPDQGINSLSIDSCKYVFPILAVGKTITIRANSNDLGKVLNFTYNRSAPHIVSVTPIQTSCSDTKDGKLKIYFDRLLVEGETLTCSILSYDQTTGEEQGVFYSTQDGQSIIIGDDLTYEIPYDFLKGKYQIKLAGFYAKDGYKANTYVMEPNHRASFTISSPTPVDFTLTPSNIKCFGGNDGIVEVTASGGADNGIYQCSTDGGSSWVNFSNGAKHYITGLPLGKCFVKVRKIKDANDKVGCIAKSAGNEKELSEEISQPAGPITISNIVPVQPTFFGGSNGKITVSISGGTPINKNSYWYQWENSKGEVLDNADRTTTKFGNGGLYVVTLNDVSKGTYTLSVHDGNYDLTTQNIGCSLNPVLSIPVDEPDPLEVILEIQRTISCNVTNEFGKETDIIPYDGQRDESQDGILVAHVKGGVPFKGSNNNGLPYKYFWKKQQDDGTWIPWDDQDETAQYLSHGNYALNIEDKNGIRLGTYVNNILDVELDSTQFMQQPPQLVLNFTKGDIFCTEGNNGWAKANVTGGTPPYTYQWTNGQKTAEITGLTTNNYFVKIIDGKGCSTQGSVLIEQPNGVVVNETIFSPSCSKGNDGFITLAPTGGITPYNYIWNTGATSQSIANLNAGNYVVTIRDAQGCISIKNFILKDPDPLTINLGPDRTLCNDQSLDLDISIANSNAQYSWTATNGFVANTAKVTLTQAGTYHAKAISELGCIAEDEIEIKTSQAVIDSEFLLTSQAYLDEEVILINTSNPFVENIQWIVPNNVTIVEQQEKYIILKFNALGAYAISLKQTQGDCYAVYAKNINVEQRSTLPNAEYANSSFITDFIVTPNPSDGNFNAIINLEKESPINLRLYAYNGQNTLIQKKESGKKKYEIAFSATLPAGMYVLVLETAQQTLVKKIIIY